MTLFLIILIVAAIAAGADFLIQRRKHDHSTKAPQAPANPMDPRAWQVGPIIDGVNSSKNMPATVQPHPLGFSFDFGEPHYVTFPHGPLTGKSRIVMRYRIEADPGVRFCPPKNPTFASLLTLYFQVKNDDWDTDGKRWWATFATTTPLEAGDHEIAADLNANWTSVMKMSAAESPAAFAQALANAERVGFTFGGGDGYGHGLFATGPARFIVTGFEIL